jgi:hypothetical protein
LQKCELDDSFGFGSQANLKGGRCMRANPAAARAWQLKIDRQIWGIPVNLASGRASRLRRRRCNQELDLT